MTHICKIIVWKTTLVNLLAIAVLINIFCISCSKIVEVKGPATSINAGNVYLKDETSAAVLTNVYATMSQSAFRYGGLTSTSLFLGLSSDEFSLYDGEADPVNIAYYKNSLTNSNTGSSDFWNVIYPVIYVANAAIEGLQGSLSLTPIVRQRLIGEAKFIRAFCYFYLVNLYGEVPIATTSDWKLNSSLNRASISSVYDQIISDLKDAQNSLSETYIYSDILTQTSDRVRPNKWAATALLARAYLFNREFDNAEQEASKVINYVSSYNLTSLDSTFLLNNNEAIWQLQPVSGGINTQEARLFVLTNLGPTASYPVFLSHFLIDSLEAGDLRAQKWIGSVTVDGKTYSFPYKYKVNAANKPVTEYTTILRLGEQFLIRAEARVELGRLDDAKKDLNVIRSRAGLSNVVSNDKLSLLPMIWREKKIELFSEWGHRWLDLNRTGNINSIMNVVTSAKGGAWNSNWRRYPIPLNDLLSSTSLKQNDGY